jgi:hypothetical protein
MIGGQKLFGDIDCRVSSDPVAGVTGVATTVASLLGVLSLATDTVAVASLDVLALAVPLLTSAVATGLMALGLLQLAAITKRLRTNSRFIAALLWRHSVGSEGSGDGFFGMDAGGVEYRDKRITLVDQQRDFGTTRK